MFIRMAVSAGADSDGSHVRVIKPSAFHVRSSSINRVIDSKPLVSVRHKQSSNKRAQKEEELVSACWFWPVHYTAVKKDKWRRCCHLSLGQKNFCMRTHTHTRRARPIIAQDYKRLLFYIHLIYRSSVSLLYSPQTAWITASSSHSSSVCWLETSKRGTFLPASSYQLLFPLIRI